MPYAIVVVLPLQPRQRMLPVACELPPPNESRGMVRAIAVACGHIAAASFLLFGPRVEHFWHAATSADVAKLTVRRYAEEAYPQWRTQHADRACPASLAELAASVDRTTSRDRKTMTDPWGHEYQFSCGDGRLYVMSVGPDGRSNTPDDIWSND